MLETLLFLALGSFETLGSKLSHGTSKKVADVRTHLRKVFNITFFLTWFYPYHVPLVSLLWRGEGIYSEEDPTINRSKALSPVAPTIIRSTPSLTWDIIG